MAPGIGAGRAALSSESVPTLANSGHCAASLLPSRASASEHDVLPSAAFGLIEKPGGRVTVVDRISDGDGVDGSWNWGTSSFTSSPEAVSVSVVVGFALRLGLKLSRSQPV